ncbi:Appr-1-p processing enzyme family [Paenibacillus mucilaginosus 3016]|uniref:Appr-1-p processing enzyme family n=1 Tax=Paenibacillus mucilaginosus 3016 TaxID=1116391 RepID=H6NLQ0_9BACL|nr:macro domain-containing protein [Paenibacillus mucilaginosus]AFC30984.1 Appr-1-p processing enzyme family [Paenibacillus mucilaginosus 3016]WFA19577.1 Appr-1-p processing protein [Paenibacillus mucilaginosus]
MAVKIIEGDLLLASEDILGHQVNCRGVMGSGVAKGIRARFPEAYTAYQSKCAGERSGTLLGQCQIVRSKGGKYIANLFGQDGFGAGGRYTQEDKLKQALMELREFARSNGLSAALPYRIGSDRGGADWQVVYGIIEEVFKEDEVTLYKLRA